jgi:hypothetical protein
LRQIAHIGLKLVPVALIGKADDDIEPLLFHEVPDMPPAPLSLRSAESWQPKAPLAAVDHLQSPLRFPWEFGILLHDSGQPVQLPGGWDLALNAAGVEIFLVHSLTSRTLPR